MAQTAPGNKYKVSIVIVTYNALDFIKICLDSIRKYTTMPYEIVVVDNLSEPPVRDYLNQQPDIKLILNDENKLWCAGSNQGIRAAGDDCTHILLLNSDIEVRRADWLQQMVNVSNSSDRIGVVGTKHTFLRIHPTFGGIDGQCMLIKKKLIDEIGLLDSEQFPWNGSPIDFAARALKKGYIYKVMPKNPELVIHYRAMSCRDFSSNTEPKARPQAIDYQQVIRKTGLNPVKIPRWAWQIYKLLPGKQFYRLTREEFLLANGKDEIRRKFYARYD